MPQRPPPKRASVQQSTMESGSEAVGSTPPTRIVLTGVAANEYWEYQRWKSTQAAQEVQAMAATTTKAKPPPAPKTERRAQKAEASETAPRAAQSAKTQSAKTARAPPEVVASSGSYSYTYSDESGEEEATSKQTSKTVPANKK